MCPNTFYDDLAETYDSHYQDGTFLAENRMIMDQLRKMAAGRSIVDIGCGTGLVLEYLDIAPEHYVGIDVSDKMLEVARRKFPDHRFVKDTFEGTRWGDLEYLKRPYLVVSLFGSPSYFVHASEIGRKLAKLPKRSAFFFMFYSHRNLGKPDYIANSEGRSISRFIYSASELGYSFGQYGFQSLSVEPFSCFLAGRSNLSERAARAILIAERMVSPILKDRGFFQIVKGIV